MRFWLLAATLAGLGVAGWMLGAAGWGQVLHVVGRLGWGGFLAYCVWSVAVAGLLGAAWAASAPPLAVMPNIARFTWARLVREGASDILPFSQVGGLVIGIRLLIARGISGPLVNAAALVDMTTEMAGQIVFTLFGIAGFVMLRSGDGGAETLTPVLIGTGAMVALMAAFFAAQRWALGLGEALFRRLLPSVGGQIGDVGAELTRIYGARGRVVLAFACNLAGWVASAAGAWIVLTLMGARAPIANVLVLESLIFVLRSVAFAIPGALGVQEAAYALLGPMLGVPVPAALALSLAKRARDLAIGLPALIAWQAGEARALRRAKGFRVQRVGLGRGEAHIPPSSSRVSAGEERT
jgi:putative membrane protein